MQEVFVTELGKTVLAPDGWSYNAVRIFADKYLCEDDNNSIFAALNRVATGVARGDEALAEHLYMGMHDQRFAFNSPVFFNVGVEFPPQCSACFIQGVEDNMDSILELAVKEGKLFQFGSGTGTNLSTLRSCKEGISGGGTASGPVSFMKVYDAVAGIVKSGGKTRRAAKMQILDVDHPDILEFVQCKAHEEQKARDLITKAGYDSSFNGEAYSSIFFQNANLSVRVTDDFMAAVENGDDWSLTARTTGLPIDNIPAQELWRAIAQAAWECGDPGLQFHDTINAWHTCPADGEIVASNPCSEYMFLNETSCNLASLNLVKYLRKGGEFDIELFQNDIEALITAMDNIIDIAGYPSAEIAHGSAQYRTLGLGYTNLGLLLMKKGLRYDTFEARELAASITALMHFTALNTSCMLASTRGAFKAFDKEAYQRVLVRHTSYMLPADTSIIWSAAHRARRHTNDNFNLYGIRNAQVTVLAPTGTISFIMDALTTGIEPAFARKVVKNLVGGGTITVDLDNCDDIPSYAVITADEVTPEQHVEMMAVCQPFLSGAISKTVNMPSTATVEDIMGVYRLAWILGLKSIAIYRDGCKVCQPLSNASALKAAPVMPRAARQPLPDSRPAITHKFSVGGHEGYLTVGMYADGRPGELFVKIAKEGSTISGMVDAFAIGLSMGLQHGIPLETLLDKHLYSRFEPSGVTTNPQIPMAHSIVDYIARWLLLQFLGETEIAAAPIATSAVRSSNACPDCGSLMVRTGSCFSCFDCGYNGGCG